MYTLHFSRIFYSGQDTFRIDSSLETSSCLKNSNSVKVVYKKLKELKYN